jgi:mono/diheme cytochrome c family protein
VKELMRYTTILLIVTLAACGGGDSAPPPDEAQQPAAEAAPAAAASTMDLPEGVTPAMVAEGETIFTGSGICYSCHMQGGVGGPLAPNLTDDVWLNNDGSYEAIVQTVMTGVPQPKEHPGIMLPKGGSPITDEQVRAVAAYVWSLSHGG